MPLIIAVLIIIVIFVCAKDYRRESVRKIRQYTAAARKTNAEMERGLVDHYMKHGQSFSDAFESARGDMIKLGFEPCIPKEAYRPQGWSSVDEHFGAKRPETSACYRCEQYDSVAIKNLKTDYKSRCQKMGVEWSKDAETQYVYGDDRVPTNAAQYDEYLTRKLKTHQHAAVPVGRFISYLGLGTCEVISLDFEQAMHTVKVLRTGEIRKVPFGDKNITKL